MVFIYCPSSDLVASYSLCPFIFLLEMSIPLLQAFSGPLHRALSAFVLCIPTLSSAVRLLLQHLHLLQIFFSLRDFPPFIISKKKATWIPPALVAQKETNTSWFFFPLNITDSLNITICGKFLCRGSWHCVIEGTRMHLSLALKDIILPIRWSLLSENNLFFISDNAPVLDCPFCCQIRQMWQQFLTGHLGIWFWGK